MGLADSMKKLLYVFLFLAILLGFLVLGLPFFINKYLNANASRILTELITRTSSFSGHEVSFGKIELNYDHFGTYLRIDNIVVSPSNVLDEDDIKINLVAKNLHLTGFKWRPLIFDNTISMDSAYLNGMEIVSSFPPWDSLFSGAPQPKKERLKKGKDYDLIEVKDVVLQDFSVSVKNNLYDSLRLALVDMDISAEGFQLTKSDIDNAKSLFHVDVVQGSIEQVEFHFDRFRQYALVNNVILDSYANKLSVGSLSLLNKQGKLKYTSQFPQRQTWMQIRDAQMEMGGVRFGSYFTNGVVEMDTLTARNLKLEVFVDKFKPEDVKKRPQMVHQAIQNLKQIIHIENVFVEGAHIMIEERPANASNRFAHLFFSDVNAHVTNVSNYLERRGKNRTISIDADAKLMGEGLLKAAIRYDLEDEQGKFTMKGTLGKMDLRKLNTMIEPEAKASIKSGTLNRLDFNILGNDYSGEGELIIRYDDLKLELLNKNYEHDNKFLKKVGAFLANTIVIRSSNPKKNGNLKKGSIYFIRETHKSMFAYWWKLLFSGLKSTLSGDDLATLKQKEADKRSGKSEEKKGLQLFKKKDPSEKPTKEEKKAARKAKKEAKGN